MKILNNLFNNKVKIETVQAGKVEGTNQSDVKSPSIFEQLNIDKTSENEKIIETLEKNNVTPTKTIMKEVTNFISSSKGDFESKLETVNRVAEKGIELTESNLTAVHEAVNGEFSEPEDLMEKFIESDIKKVIKKLRKLGVKPELLKNIEKMMNEGSVSKDDLSKLIRSLVFGKSDEGSVADFISEFSEEMKAIWLDLGPSLAIEGITEKLGEKLYFEPIVGPSIEDEIEHDGGKKVKSEAKVMKKEEHKDDFGKVIASGGVGSDPEVSSDKIESDEDVSREASHVELEDVLQNFLSRVEESVSEVVTYETLSLLAQGHQFESKSFLVKEVTEQMLTLKEDFLDFKKGVNENLSKVIRDMEVHKKVTVDTKELISKTIEKTDNLLMKSDIPLFTSIKTEKQLLLLSSDLESARSFLEEGQYQKSLGVLKKVSTDINRLLFDPSAKKVVAQSSELITNSPQVTLTTEGHISPRNVLETLRNLGLNHESEMADKAFSNKNNLQEKINENAKSILLKMVNKNSTEHKVDALGEKNLNNLLGQQFMNKLEPHTGMQKMLFNIPIKTDQDVKNLKVHVNGKKKNEKMDWKNTSMYFLINLDHYGETGIKVDSVDAHVKITVKNDEFEIMKDREDVVREMSDKLQEIGFTIDAISFTSLTERKESIDAGASNFEKRSGEIGKGPIVSEEGFDFKI